MIEQKVFLIDYQTTGTSATKDYLLEAAWCCYQAKQDPFKLEYETHRISLPDDLKIPAKITRLTGLRDSDKETLVSYEACSQMIFNAWQEQNFPPLLIHYAQFERAFTDKMHQDFNWPGYNENVEYFCTHRLAKILQPGLSSYTLRAVAGFLGLSLDEPKRSKDHLLASAFIWHKLAHQLPSDVKNAKLEVFRQFYKESKPSKVTKKLSYISPQKRLELSKEPGVYHFIDHTDRILYVGKAKSLKSRVNSYFTGRQSKGSRLNELLARIRDIKTYSCSCELEALLKENDDIKKFDPPYNRQLRAKQEQFLDRHTLHEAIGPLPSYLVGEFSWLLELAQDQKLIENPESEFNLWGRKTNWLSVKKASREAFLAFELPLNQLNQKDMFKFIAKSLEFLSEKNDLDEDDLDELEANLIWDHESLLEACLSRYVHFGYQLYRLKWLLRIIHADIFWKESRSWYHLRVNQTGYQIKKLPARTKRVYASTKLAYQQKLRLLDQTSYDRLAIVYRFLRQLSQANPSLELFIHKNIKLSSEQLQSYLV